MVMIMLQLFSSLFSASDDFLERFDFCILFVSRALLEAFCLLASSPGFRQYLNEISSRLANGPRPNVETIFLCWFCEQALLAQQIVIDKYLRAGAFKDAKTMENFNNRAKSKTVNAQSAASLFIDVCFYFKVMNVEHHMKRLAHVPHSALQFIFVSLGALR